MKHETIYPSKTTDNIKDLEESTNTDDSIRIEEHRTKEAAADRRKAMERDRKIKKKSTKGKEPTINEQ